MTEEQLSGPSHPMVNLGHDVFDNLSRYECARAGPNCPSYRALSALLALGRSGKDCTVDKDYPMCRIAEKLLSNSPIGEVEAVDVDFFYPLLMSTIHEDVPFISEIFNAVEGFVCHKEGERSEGCNEFKKIHQMYEEVNKAVQGSGRM